MNIQSRYNVKTNTTTFINMGDDNKGWSFIKSIAGCYVNRKGVDCYEKEGRFLLAGVVANGSKVTNIVTFKNKKEMEAYLESYEDFDGRIQASGLSELFNTISVN